MKRCSPDQLWSLDLPTTDYGAVLELQHQIAGARAEGRLKGDGAVFAEHPPVFTLGRNGGRENLAVAESFLQERGIRVIQIERGGNITYHGPGQLVVYPILNLEKARLGVRDYVSVLEQAMVRTAADWGISASGNEENRGVWVEDRKLGSIGVAVRRKVCFHGLALNVRLSLEPFSWINPCGLRNIRITSMQKEISGEVSMRGVRKAMKRHLGNLLGKKFAPPLSLDDSAEAVPGF